MPETSEQLFVKSHVARDLLQTAGLFKNERLAVWEYVANSLQYTDLPPVVSAAAKAKRPRAALRAVATAGQAWHKMSRPRSR
jgi:hypothetical protein